MVKLNNLSWMIGGEAGSGVQSAGRTLALAASRAGLHVFGNSEFPSLIRGGHNTTQIRVTDFETGCHSSCVDLLLAMNKEALTLHIPALSEEGGVVYDSEEITDFDEIPSGVKVYGVPLKRLAVEIGGGLITRNIVGLGATFAILKFDISHLLEVLSAQFGKKGEDVVKKNAAAARAGYDYIVENFADTEFGYALAAAEDAPSRMMITGNDAFSLGALKAGVKFVAEYPMTPSSSVLHFMSKRARDYNIVVKHTEDEIAAINMVIGASWAGARAMTATSGGGFSLMTEALGMAGMIETPAVIYEVQRPGPSTGLPTRTEQGDLQFVIHASQGEFPRLVVAPGDYSELFYKTFEAFNLADGFQIPAIILGDKFLGESIKNIEPFKTADLVVDRGKLVLDEKKLATLLGHGYASANESFLRYKMEEDGVSYRTIPGTIGGRHRASTDEHDESGDLTETEDNRVKMQEKRMHKLESLLDKLPAPMLVGPSKDRGIGTGPAFPADEADITFVSWGSTKGALLEVMQKLRNDGVKANLLQIVYFVPFHEERIKEMLSKAKLTVGVEMNSQAQMSNFVREKTGIEIDHRILKWSGRQFTPEEIYDEVNKILNPKLD